MKKIINMIKMTKWFNMNNDIFMDYIIYDKFQFA